jgi:hypothetical protein
VSVTSRLQFGQVGPRVYLFSPPAFLAFLSIVLLGTSEWKFFETSPLEHGALFSIGGRPERKIRAVMGY